MQSEVCYNILSFKVNIFWNAETQTNIKTFIILHFYIPQNSFNFQKYICFDSLKILNNIELEYSRTNPTGLAIKTYKLNEISYTMAVFVQILLQ